jgi:hypothetical protein
VALIPANRGGKLPVTQAKFDIEDDHAPAGLTTIGPIYVIEEDDDIVYHAMQPGYGALASGLHTAAFRAERDDPVPSFDAHSGRLSACGRTSVGRALTVTSLWVGSGRGIGGCQRLAST